MKKIWYVIALVITSSALFADEIYLKNGTVVKGNIIQITRNAVEYDPEGPSAFDRVDRDQVVKVVYDGGREVRMALDTIEFTSGETIQAAVKKVTAESITYVQEGATEEKTVPRKDVARILFGDGRSFEISQADKQDAQVEDKPLPGYHQAWVRLSLFGGGGALYGGVADKERRVFRAYRPDLMLANIVPWTYDINHAYASGGVEADVMPPAISFAQKRRFDFSGLKFGVRARYGYEQAISIIARDDTSDFDNDFFDDILYGGVMRYHYWTAGPSVSFIFSPRSNIAALLLTAYVTGGQVFDGRLNPMSALRDSKLLTLRVAGGPQFWNIPPIMGGDTELGRLWNLLALSSSNRTKVRGYTIRAGLGPEFSLNRHFPLVVGIRITYAYTRLTFGRPPAIYADGNVKAAHHQAGVEASVGIHI